ncbi:hypothetical protein D9611_002589 [Ephemerocybe angulata]|uniref:Uncharacterized protein n=1 Tax=Ephemerocybe angulata TaxID=980116 RepID=A0A8H5C3R2_9AGAR|nr:hypothetical protein D9611_002589 [Tulosesus angulatus]
MFIVLGGAVFVGMLIALTRFIHVHLRAPKRDRMAEVLERRQVQQEIWDIQRQSVMIRPNYFEPAPPYFPPPPTYDFAKSSPVRSTPPYTDASVSDELPSGSTLLTPNYSSRETSNTDRA